MRRIIIEVGTSESGTMQVTVNYADGCETATARENAFADRLAEAVRVGIILMSPGCSGAGDTLDEAEVALGINLDIRKAGGQ